MSRLAVIDRLTGERLRGRRHSLSERCYERAHPGDLLHVDVMKLGRIPDGGGWRVHGRAATVAHRHKPTLIGFDYVRVAIDERSRLAYVEVLPDERTGTCAGRSRASGPDLTHSELGGRRLLAEPDLPMGRRRRTSAAAVCEPCGRPMRLDVVFESPLPRHTRDRLPIVREESARRMGVDLLEVVESDRILAHPRIPEVCDAACPGRQRDAQGSAASDRPDTSPRTSRSATQSVARSARSSAAMSRRIPRKRPTAG